MDAQALASKTLNLGARIAPEDPCRRKPNEIDSRAFASFAYDNELDLQRRVQFLYLYNCLRTAEGGQARRGLKSPSLTVPTNFAITATINQSPCSVLQRAMGAQKGAFQVLVSSVF